MVPLLIESTASYAGKTMICLGLGLTFQKDGFSVSYFKPFGRSPVREGKTYYRRRCGADTKCF